MGPLSLSGLDRCLPPTYPGAKDLTHRCYQYTGVVNEAERARNRFKFRTRSRVGHAFAVIKGVFHFT